MPKAIAMAQLSRPYQIALAAVVAALGLFAMWSLVLHHSSPEASGGSGSAAAASASAHAASGTASSSTPTSPSSAAASSSGASEGYGSAIEKAHAAVSESQQNARQLENRSAQASNEAIPARTAPAGASPQVATKQAAPAGAAVRAHQHVVHKQPLVHVNTAELAKLLQESEQQLLKVQLAQGKTVLLLFWNPKSTDDIEVHKQLQAVAAHLKGKVAIHMAEANQVGQYSSVTRNVQVLQTPTLLIVGKKGLALTLTGLVDQYAIEQGIQEAAKA
jgi:hypothetical protein